MGGIIGVTRGRRAWTAVLVCVVTAAGLIAVDAAPPAEAASTAPGALASTGDAAMVSPTRPKGDFLNRPDGVGSSRDPLDRRPRIQSGAALVDELTTPTREVFANPDGTNTMRVSSVPTRFKSADGAWHDVDLSLTTAPSGDLVATSSPVGVTLPTDPSRGLARWPVGGGELVFSTDVPVGPGAIATDARRASGEPLHTAEWVGAVGAPSARVALTVDGFDQQIVFADASRSSYSLRVAMPSGYSARQIATGVEIADRSGTVMARIDNGSAYDASGARVELGVSSPVSVDLAKVTAGVADLTVSVDSAWLGAPDRVFPVVVDPMVHLETASGGGGQAYDTWTDYFQPSTPHGSDTALKVGAWNSLQLANAYLHFDLSSIPVAETTMLNFAYLDIEEIAATNALEGGHSLDAFGIGGDATSQPWSSATTWSTAPVNDGKGIRGRFDWAGDSNGYGGAGRVHLSLNELVSSWIHDGQPNNGLELTATNWSDPKAARMFSSGDAGWNAPRLVIEYFTGPAAAMHPAPTSGVVMASQQPTLSVDAVTGAAFWFRVTTGADAESGVIAAESGWVTNQSWQVPAGALSDGGTYYWHTYTNFPVGGNGWWTKPRWVNSFKVRLRLGAASQSPMDSGGPVQVNLATGNVYTQSASPSVTTVGGAIGVSYAYNSLGVQPQTGLNGSYYQNESLSGAPAVKRRDQALDFVWNWSPAPPIPAAYWSAQWLGYVTVPSDGIYSFGAVADNGVRVFVNGTLVYDKWTDTPTTSPTYGTAVTLNAGVRVGIRVDYYNTTGNGVLQLWEKDGTHETIVPASWLTPNSSSSPLPDGWQFSADLGGSLGYTNVRMDGSNAVLVGADGSTTTFLWVNGGYKAPEGSDETLTVTPGTTGGLTLHSAGTTYVFNADGTLASAQGSLDDRKPAAAQYTYSGNPARLAAITDPSSGRAITLAYGDGNGGVACGSDTPTFINAPASMLCRITYPDGRVTRLYYVSDGNAGGLLARIEDPGSEITDYAYTNGKLTSVRDPLAYDMIARALRVDDPTARTVIGYSSATGYTGWADSVTQPAPNAGDLRPAHSYTHGTATFAYNGATPSLPYTDVHVAGLTEPNGYARRAVYSLEARRTLIETDTAGLATTSIWNETVDGLASTTDPTGLRTTTIYDPAGRPTDTYGPAPAGWFDPLTNLPVAPHVAGPATGADVTHTHTGYDEGLTRLGVAYWNSKGLDGPPAAHTTGIDGPDGILRDWASASPTTDINATNWGARLTGTISLSSAGVYQFPVYADDGVRMWIDDTLVIDSWADGQGWKQWGVYWNTDTAKPHRFRIDYYNLTGPAMLKVFWITPGSGNVAPVPVSVLAPAYGLPTSTTDADGRTTTTEYDGTGTPLGALDPAYGLVTATVVDPGAGHLNLRTVQDYERERTGLLRPTTRDLPNGITTRTTTSYYAPKDAASAGAYATIAGGSSVTGCNTNPFQQGGLAKQTTDPLGAMVDTIYDDNGRVIGTQHSGDMRWTCMIYDVRGRVTDVTNRNANLVHTHYYLPGQGADVTCGTIEPNQVCTRFADSAGTTRFTKTESDLLGRTVKYTDELGTQTRTLYDQVGRVIERWRKLPAVTDKKILSYAYDSYGRASSWSEFVSATAGRTTTTFYDTYSRPIEVDRPTNTYPLRTVMAYEANTGRLDMQVSSRNTTTLFSNNLDYSLAGRISQDARIGAGRQYAYDGAGRLTSATDTPSGTVRAYGFDANSNRCANATTCGSPTFSYNVGDQLAGSPYGSGYLYDTYGNLDVYAKTGGGIVNFDYDSFDHTIRIDDSTTRVDSVLSPDGRVLRRTVSSPPGVTITEDRWYGYTDSSDSPAWSQATSGGAYTTYLSNLIVTGTTPSYQLSDPKGTIVGTVTQAGAFTTNSYPDEYGNIVTVPASRLDWLGTQRRFVDHLGLDITRMGVRAYDPHIGRFLSQDPIAGGSANDYDYVNADPINNLDLGGTFCMTGVARRDRFIKRWVVHVDARGRRRRTPVYGEREVCRSITRGVTRWYGSQSRSLDRSARVLHAGGACLLGGDAGVAWLDQSFGNDGGTVSATVWAGGCAAGVVLDIWGDPAHNPLRR